MQLDDMIRSVRTAGMAPPSEPPAGQPAESQCDEYAIRTYRYVRVLIVALTIGLLTAVIVEWTTANCQLGSLSAYYYTPARGMFTGGLIGVCLVAIRGENDFQDGLLNVAGLFGPMVALIPMHLNVGSLEHPSWQAKCIASASRIEEAGLEGKGTAFSLVTAGRVDAIRNNTWALLFMLGFGLLLLAWSIAYARRHPRAGVPEPKWWPWVVSLLMTVAVWVLYHCYRDLYVERVHFTVAMAMFAAISFFAIFDGRRTIKYQRAVKRGRTYIALGVLLLAGCGAIMLIGNCQDWRHTTFWVEVWGIAVFLVFWVMQTIDLWNHTSRATAILSANPDPEPEPAD
jgi:hypothetical protein